MKKWQMFGLRPLQVRQRQGLPLVTAKEQEKYDLKKIFFTVSVILCTISAKETAAFVEYAMACDEGNPEACYKAGKIYSANAHTFKDYTAAKASERTAYFYKRSCNLGYAPGCTAYGMSYASDKSHDPQKSPQYYFQKLARVGISPDAIFLKVVLRASIRRTTTTRLIPITFDIRKQNYF
jgi:TPR repeat protein